MIGHSVNVAMRATTGLLSLRTTARAVMLLTVSAGCGMALILISHFESRIFLDAPMSTFTIEYTCAIRSCDTISRADAISYLGCGLQAVSPARVHSRDHGAPFR